MKWTNHKIITLSITSFLTLHPLYLASSFLGSTFPDAIEDNKDKISFKNHRQISHWFIPYILVYTILFIYKVLKPSLNFKANTIISCGMYFTLGCLCHLFLDALTGTIPGINPKKHKSRWGKKLIKNEIEESLIAFIIMLLAIIVQKY